MTLVRQTAALFGGVTVGVAVSWGLGLVWLAILDIETGALAVPLVLTLGLAWATWRWRTFAVGIAVGALAETAFFLYLFQTWTDGMKSL